MRSLRRKAKVRRRRGEGKREKERKRGDLCPSRVKTLERDPSNGLEYLKLLKGDATEQP